MAAVAIKKAAIAGTTVTKVAASAGGDTIVPSDRASLLVENTDAVSHTVTIAVPGNTKYGQPQPDVAVIVPAGATVAIGSFPADLADSADGLVHLSYDGVTGVNLIYIYA